MIRRKWTFRARGKRIVLVKRVNEQSSHVLMKAFLWTLCLPDYPDLSVEISIGDRYKPDVVALDSKGRPAFWGEAGQLGIDKIRSLLKRFRSTHFAVAKWDVSLNPFLRIFSNALAGIDRDGPVDLIRFPADSIKRFINERGDVHIDHNMLEWVRMH